jgi:hypothetical protein
MRPSSLLLLASVLLFVGCRPNTNKSAYDAEWEAQSKRTRAQMDDYDRQTKRVDEMQGKMAEQNLRFEKVLEKWEEQARRYDAILETMEKQQGVKK